MHKEDEQLKLTVSEQDGTDDASANVDKKSAPPPDSTSSKRTTHPIRDPYVGTTLNERYHILSLIGKGATSTVYRAEDEHSKQTVAIKILHSHLIAESVIVRRFEQEAKTASLLQHPNIVCVHNIDITSGGNPFLVMEFVEGTSLLDAIRAAGWLPAQRVLSIFSQVCAALAVAHEKGVVHRDLKPSNIMLTTTADGDILVKVLDFGIAKILPVMGDTVLKLTQTGETLGSLLYMSPEQCLDQDLDGRSDCYSVGCVMYEALTGKPPICARTAFETMNKHMTEMPEQLDKVRPDVAFPRGTQEVLFKAMSKSPDQRYQTIGELQDDLGKLLSGSTPMIKVDLPISDFNRQLSTVIKDETSPEQLQMQDLQARKIIKTTKFISMFLFVATVVCVGIALPNGLDLVNPMASVAFSIMMFWVISWGVYSIVKTDYSRIIAALAMMSQTRPVTMSLININQALDNSLYFIVDVAESDPHAERKRLKISPKSRMDPLWGSLCSASQLEGLVRTNVFPVSIEVYFDANEKPRSVSVRGLLAWVVE